MMLRFHASILIVAVGWSVAFSQNQAPALANPSATNPTDPERMQAMEFYKQHRLPDAALLLTNVVARYPNDVVAHERLGASLISKSDADTDAAQAKADLIKAREELLKAQSLGDNSELLRTLLEMVPENGERAAFSGKGSVDAAMQRGEAAFAQGKFDDALREYAAAYELDPTLYIAALDTGDVYFRLKQTDKAEEWFGRAVEINPNQETAYRYWGDALLQAGNNKEARSKYIQGLAAFPYTNASWVGLKNWLAINHLAFRQINIPIPSSVTPNEKGGINITLDPSTMANDDGGSAWLMYGLARASWRQEKFAKEFPSEKEYRHSLKEEVDALSLTATSYNQQRKDGKIKHPNPGLELLTQIENDHMLEPYVLLVKPDKDITKDFATFQAAHKETLIVFIDKYLVPPAPDSAPTLTNIKPQTAQ